MASFTILNPLLLAVTKAAKASQGLAFYNNLFAAREGATDAPYEQAQWHPYDGTAFGDGNDGLIYDFAVDGTVASIVTPDFADGYDYRLVFVDISDTGGVGTAGIEAELYRETTGSYDSAFQIVALPSGSDTRSAVVDFLLMRTACRNKIVGGVNVQLSSAQKVTRARISSVGSNNLDGGKIYMHRRLTMIP